MNIKLVFSMSILALFCPSANAALPVGSDAPDFTTAASLAGEEIEFELAEALETGPVVLYFYPAAFTPGCTIEAHEFAEASDDFAKHNATIIGVSGDDLETLHRFSVSECREKFAVAADERGRVIRAYDAAISGRPDIADRISYVISQEGKVVHVHKAASPYGHISESLEAVKSLRQNAQ